MTSKKEKDQLRQRDDDLVNNILPSYHMFQSTVSKNLTPTDENFRVDPPMYEMTPVSSATPSLPASVLQSAIQSPTSNLSVDEFPFPEQHQDQVFNGDSVNLWENTILANVHKLPNLSKSDNKICQDLEIDINVTENVCRKGVEPTIINPSKSEFKQGDYIHGYVTIRNKSNRPISFDMVYVVFEGTLVVLENNRGLIDTNKPTKVHKFLNMLDLFASWSYANIDRLATDNGDPHDWCDGETDPWDNTVLSIDVKRLFQPNVTYKRFFTFRVPEKLLDNTCEGHNFSSHMELPPSIGMPKALPSSLLMNKTSQIKDFSIIDTSISYSIDARIIGKTSDYKHSINNEQYVVAQESTCNVRIIPQSNQNYVFNSYSMNYETSLFYRAFVDSIQRKIELGNDLLHLPSEQRNALDLSPQPSRDNSFVKLRQLYTVADGEIKRKFKHSNKQFSDDIYQYLTPFKKKSITGSSKVLGVISLSSPKHEYRALYVPPVKFRKAGETYDNTILTIPFEISYLHTNTPNKDVQFPDIKNVSIELVALTIRSGKYPIPIEFNHEMCFRDQEIYQGKKHEPETFDSIIVKPFQKHLMKLISLIKSVGNDLLKIESQLLRDIKCIASLSTKYINLPVSHPKFISRSPKSNGSHIYLSTIPWELQESTQDEYSLYSKVIDVQIDLKNCQLKGQSTFNGDIFDHVTLVPSFQSCQMARMYYLKTSIRISTGEVLTVNVPVYIEN